jgi:FMN phosphatase YigB (HAD superfamily)
MTSRSPAGRACASRPSGHEIGCEHLGVDPTEVVMVDALAQNNVAAERLEMTGVVHKSGRDTLRELGQLHIASRWV